MVWIAAPDRADHGLGDDRAVLASIGEATFVFACPLLQWRNENARAHDGIRMFGIDLGIRHEWRIELWCAVDCDFEKCLSRLNARVPEIGTFRDHRKIRDPAVLDEIAGTDFLA